MAKKSAKKARKKIASKVRRRLRLNQVAANTFLKLKIPLAMEQTLNRRVREALGPLRESNAHARLAELLLKGAYYQIVESESGGDISMYIEELVAEDNPEEGDVDQDALAAQEEENWEA